MTLCPFLKAEGWEQEPGEVSWALLPTWGLWGSLSGQGRARQRDQCSLAWGGEQTGLICATDPHRLHGSEQDRDRLCRVPVRRKVPDSSPASRVSGITAHHVCACAMLAGPPPSPRERTQAAGWKQLPAPALAAWGAAGRCWGKQGAGKGAGQGLPQEPATGVPGLTSHGISVDTGTDHSCRSHAHLQWHCTACPQGAAAHLCG